MDFTLSCNKAFVPDDLRTTFKELVRTELAAIDPTRAAKLLFKDEPEQLEFNFSSSTESLS